MKIFDSHTHLNDEPFAGKTDYYLQRAQALDVLEMAIIGSNKLFNQTAIELAQKYPQLHAVIGWHPEFTNEYNLTAEQELIAQLQLDEVIAIGEIGLDYHWPQNPQPAQQKELFARQLDLAEQYQLPVNIHTRDAFADTYEVLKAHQPHYGVIMHSFNGPLTWLSKFLDLGCYISYSGVVSFKNAPDVRAAAQNTPANRLLVETDAPYLTPEPHRGEQNEPGFTHYVAAAVAQCRQETLEQVAANTWKNAHEVYRLNEKN
ncbi:hydrolase TatD [Bombilactobacillus bombi]|uniref:Hydrolase TatD n=1 Tax=Bombilactobacillus bombi TaxID=1303590 RepID=A0A3R6Z9V6_9LACO|nr:TatD family hydrolase [Bombilactobacillus bombi]RHW47781.1 hydrolase TatD [Bombilactobacillus bombi]